MKDGHTRFIGTYFDKDTVLRIVRAAKIVAWIVVGIYGAHLLISLWTFLTLILQGNFVGVRFLDIAQNLITLFEQVLLGGVFFFVLMGIAHLLLILLDVEDNTRRAARQ